MQDGGSQQDKRTPWEADTRFVSIFLATGFLIGEQAQSLLLVGEPSAGKSALIQRFRQIPTARHVSDLTSDGIRRVLADDESNEVRHILVDDFNRLFARRGPVAEQTAALLTSLMSGDAGIEIIGHKQWDFRGRQIGIIGAMTRDLFQDRENDLRANGLLSRLYVVRMRYDQDEEKRIIHNILAGHSDDLTPIAPTIGGQLMQARKVASNTALADSMMTYLSQLNGRFSRRGATQMVRFLKAIAYMRGASKAEPCDLSTLKRFTPYFHGMSGKIEEDE